MLIVHVTLIKTKHIRGQKEKGNGNGGVRERGDEEWSEVVVGYNREVSEVKWWSMKQNCRVLWTVGVGMWRQQAALTLKRDTHTLHS